MAMEKLVSLLEKNLKNKILEMNTQHGDVTIYVALKDLLTVLSDLKDSTDLAFHQLIDIFGVDYPNRTPRFEVVYHLLSMRKNWRIRVKVRVDEGTPVPSCISVFEGAVWWEREVWDMYGIPFADHPDLRRLLTDYTFDGHPLRKDFPLTGYVEVVYDDVQKRVVYETVKLQQAYRDFDYLSPWEGMTPTLPGDEKATGDTDGKEGT